MWPYSCWSNGHTQVESAIMGKIYDTNAPLYRRNDNVPRSTQPIGIASNGRKPLVADERNRTAGKSNNSFLRCASHQTLPRPRNGRDGAWGYEAHTPFEG